jgi:tetratricopeptide (TPR) repeat protein
MKPLVGTLLLAALAAGEAPRLAPPALADRLQWNARERTATGARALAAGDDEHALEAFDAAHRLRPDDPRTAFNAGTARIAGDAAGAAALLDPAARAAGPDLAPAAWYNLGTARLAAGDAQGAVEALREALRRAPDSVDAKQNLELALHELDRQRERETPSAKADESQPTPQRSSAAGEEGSSDEGGDPAPQTPPEANGEPRPQEGAPDPSRSGADRPAPDPLPQFRDLPDMTAEQAAAILRAVEDLERQQRRERARRTAGQRAQVEIDW